MPMIVGPICHAIWIRLRRIGGVGIQIDSTISDEQVSAAIADEQLSGVITPDEITGDVEGSQVDARVSGGENLDGDVA